MLDALTRDRRWFASSIAVATVWTIELFLVQQFTLVSANDIGLKLTFGAPLVRLAFDLVFTFGLVLCLRRGWLTLCLLAACFVHIGLITYYNYFLQPLSLLTLMYNAREGLAVSEFAFQRIPMGLAVGLVVACGVKLAFVWRVRRPAIPFRTTLAWVATCAVAYGVLFVGRNWFDPLNRILTKRGVGRLGMIRGYAGPWLAEWYYLNDTTLLARAEARKSQTSDQLSAIEGDIPIGALLVIIQCESLDFRAVQQRVHGQLVMPFLNELKDRSMFYRIRAVHSNGTADADFTTITGYSPSTDVITYNIPNYRYEHTLPQLLHESGFVCRSLHGYWGAFYNRRFAFRKIGFDDILFQEELKERFGFSNGRFGILDEYVLNASNDLLQRAAGREFHFIITLSTHGPYNYIRPADNRLFPAATTLGEKYLNSLNYLDRCLRDYYERLPHGATVMLYGDQCASESTDEFSPDRDGRKEYVPCFFFRKGQDFAALQKTRDTAIATDGSLSLLDAISYFRAQITRAPIAAPGVGESNSALPEGTTVSAP